MQKLPAKVEGHLTRINDILTNLMEAERRGLEKVGLFSTPRDLDSKLWRTTTCTKIMATKMKRCHQCESVNATDQAFCGACGSPLALEDFISKKVSEHLQNAIRDRDVIETESSIRVFERAWGWVKIVGGIATVLLAILSAGIVWKVSDWKSTVENAQTSVRDTAKEAEEQIKTSSSSSLQTINAASGDAQEAGERASAAAKKQSGLIAQTAAQTRSELSKESASVRDEVAKTDAQLQAADALRPGMESTQQQLEKALAQVQDQQKVISSSQEFVRQIFSTHTVDIFQVGQGQKDRYAVVPPSVPGGNTVVIFLLQSAPIQGTVQLQYHIFSQPPNSYIILAHNMLLFFWGDPPKALEGKPISISYFADVGDKDLIHALTEKDGRLYADGEPLPKFNQPDPDFKGNKWMPMQSPASSK